MASKARKRVRFKAPRRMPLLDGGLGIVFPVSSSTTDWVHYRYRGDRKIWRTRLAEWRKLRPATPHPAEGRS
jgi:hypothetical protein